MRSSFRSIAWLLLATSSSLAAAHAVATYKVNLERDDATLWGSISTGAFGRLQGGDFLHWNFEFHYGGHAYVFPPAGEASPQAGCPAAGCGVLAGQELRFSDLDGHLDEALYFGDGQRPGVAFSGLGATVNFMPRTGGSMQTYRFVFDQMPYVIGRLPTPSTLALVALGLGGLSLLRRGASGH